MNAIFNRRTVGLRIHIEVILYERIRIDRFYD